MLALPVIVGNAAEFLHGFSLSNFDVANRRQEANIANRAGSVVSESSASPLPAKRNRLFQKWAGARKIRSAAHESNGSSERGFLFLSLPTEIAVPN
jgi:hypothetical protein